MRRVISFGIFAMLVALFACKRSRPSKNDDIAACNASGGQWVEGGCTDSGRCERPSGMAPDDDDDDERYEEDED
jgi:hypothetical protein